MSTKTTRRLLITGIVALLASPLVALPASAEPVHIDIYTSNDFHGRLEAGGTAPDSPGGAAYIAGAFKAYKAANPNSLLVAAGDNIGATTFPSFINDDKPTIEAFNAMGLSVSALGNHEFDKGRADIDGRIAKDIRFDYIAANVFEKGTDKHAYKPFSIQKVDGVSIGFIGAVTPDVPAQVSPEGVATLDFRDMAESVNKVADELTDGNDANGEADVLILLVHDGASSPDLATATDNNTKFGQLVNNASAKIKAIVSAHTHQLYNHVIAGRPVIQAKEYGDYLGKLALSWDKTTKTATITSSMIQMVPNDPAIKPDPEVAKIVADAVAKAEVLGAKELGKITADLIRGEAGENRGVESTLGNFVADVHLWAGKQSDPKAQIALMNPGGLRTDMKFGADGKVTYKDAAMVQPFANTLMLTTLTGAQLKSVLEEQWQPDGSSRPMLKLGISEGFFYTYDPAAAAGSRITSMTLAGKAIDPAANYRVVANAFLANGGDNFPTLAKGTDRADTGRVDLQAQVDWFAANSPGKPDYKQRSVGITVTSKPANGTAYVRGETFAAKLSGLSFTNGEPKPAKLAATIEGTDFGSFDVDSTVVPAVDTTGQASISIPIDERFDKLAPAAAGTSPAAMRADAAPAADPADKIFMLTLTGDPNAAIEVGIPVGIAAEGDIPVAAQPPTVNVVCGPANDEIVPAATPGVSYTVSPYEGNVATVKATANSGYTLTGTDTWTVTDEATACDDATGPGGDLPRTGFNAKPFIIGALLLVVAGGVLMAAKRRRS